MSLKDELEKKNAGILTQSTSDRIDSGMRSRRGGPRTAPGALFGLSGEMRDAEIREQELRAKLEGYEGSLPVFQLDPNVIRLSQWANRHEQSFIDKDFASFKSDIKQAGGNVQPIKVRPLADATEKYELIFGQRRLRACIELGISVNALVEPLSDKELFLAMELENRGKEDLSPFELGLHYERALTTGLWPSQNSLADGVGLNQAYVSRLLALASLPKDVIAAFPSVLDIQAKWGADIVRKMKGDKDGVIKRARAVAKDPSRTAKQVINMLLARAVPLAQSTHEFTVDGTVRAIRTNAGGEVSLRFVKDALDEKAIQRLDALVLELIEGEGG